MSEYQYYEFQAIDRPLTAGEMATLRKHSTRARITPTSFVNEYHWGDFKGDPDAWMTKYFDAFLYLANWGTRTFKLRRHPGLSPPRQRSPTSMATASRPAAQAAMSCSRSIWSKSQAPMRRKVPGNWRR